jgi:hypothetical protein
MVLFDFLLFSRLALFLIGGLLFTRISVSYLDNKLRAEGSGIPQWDSGGFGLRVGMYALILIRNKPKKESLLKDEFILKHARSGDRILAFCFNIGLFMTVFLGAIETIFFKA